MADTFTALLRLVLQETGGNQNVWGSINNASAISLLETAIAGRTLADVTAGNVVLTTANGASDQSRSAVLVATGNPGVARTITVPSTSKVYVVSNETSPGFNVTIKTAAGTGVVVSSGALVFLMVDPTLDEVFQISAASAASEAVAGIAEIATQAETNTGTDDTRIVSPLKLANATSLLQATETQKGALEIATQAETDLGTDDVRALTPLKLENRKATEILFGIIELATQAEVDAGVDAVRAVTPATLKASPVTVGVSGAKAFHSAAQSIAGTGADVVVSLNSEAFDTDTIHDNITDNSRLTVPTGVTRIRLIANVHWQASSSSYRTLKIRKGGADGAIDDDQVTFQPWCEFTANVGPNTWHQQCMSGTIRVVATDFFEMVVRQGSGGALNLIANQSFFEMEIVA